MKLSIKLAGLLGSGAFIVTALPGFFQHIKPTSLDAMVNEALPGMSILETVGVSLLGALIAGVIGFKIGEILSSPAGNHPRHRNRPSPSRSGSRQAATVTGEETFLDDVEPAVTTATPAVTILPIETAPIDDV